MSDYGVQSTGFVRKPLSVILAELELAMVTEFGPGVVQTPQSPLGQLNGLMADLASEMWERSEEIYQSYDPDQAEGSRLDILARLRLINRASETDPQIRRSITNEGFARVTLQDFARELAGISGVEYSRVWINDAGELDRFNIAKNDVSVVVDGGSDPEIANVVRDFIVPGISTHGTHVVNSSVAGYCQSFFVTRPIYIYPEVTLRVETFNDRDGCPAPSLSDIKSVFIQNWNAQVLNSQEMSASSIRKVVECDFSNVNVLSFTATLEGQTPASDQTLNSAFEEIIKLTDENVSIVE